MLVYTIMQDYDEYCDNEGQNNEYQAEELNDTDYEVESNDHEQLPVFLGRPSSPMKTHMVISFTNTSNSIETYLS